MEGAKSRIYGTFVGILEALDYGNFRLFRAFS